MHFTLRATLKGEFHDRIRGDRVGQFSLSPGIVVQPNGRTVIQNGVVPIGILVCERNSGQRREIYAVVALWRRRR